MKRILFVGAGQSFPAGAFAFLQSLQEEEPVSITGLFFLPIDFRAEITASMTRTSTPYEQLMEREKQQLNANKDLFEKECRHRNWSYKLHDSEVEWDKDLFAKETRFADLVVLSSEFFYEGVDTDEPNLYLKEALRGTECPVMIVPEKFIAPEKVIIAYDGGRECLFAIKQFCYLFPGYTELPAEIVYTNEGSSDKIPEIERIKEFARLHFGSMGIERIPLRSESFADVCAGMRQQPLLVTGSYGRSRLSYITRQSFARQTIHNHQLPVFIAHH